MPDSSVLTTEAVPPHTMPAHGQKASSQMKTTALAKSSSAVFLSTMLGRVLNFATQVLLSNALGLAAFGAFTLGQSLLSFLTAFSQAGLHQATARFLAMGRAQQRPQMVRGVMWFAVPRVVLISVVLGLGLVVLRVPLATLVFHKPEIAPVLFWVGMALPFLSGLNWLGFALRGFRAATMEALLKEVLQPAIFLLLGCGLLLFGGASLEGMWWAFLCGTVASAACGCYHVYRHMHSTPRVKPDRAVGSAMRRFAIPIWFNRLLVALLNQGDRLMLGAFSQVAQVGMYHAAYRIAAFQSMAMTSFVPMFSTAIAEAHACDDRAAIIQHYRTAVRWSVLTTLPVCLVCMTFASEILHIFGKEFEP